MSSLNLILFFFTLISYSWANQGFFSDDFENRSSPEFNSAMSANFQSTESPTARFQIQTTQSIHKVLPTIWGNNSNFYLYGLEGDSAGLEHLRATGAKNLRLPGGNVSNTWLWDGQIKWNFWENYTTDITSKPTQLWNLSVDQQAAIADSIGAMPQPCVNVALARFIQGADSVEQAASYAADWVRQWNIVEGRNVKYWEVGNENYGGWSSGYIVNGDTINGTMYGQMFNIFADSMKAVDPSIKVGAVVYEGENAQWTGAWNQELLPIVQDHADFLAVHQYFTYAPDYNDVSVQEVIDGLALIQETKELLENHVETYTNKAKDHFPIAMTEYNVRAGRKNSQQISAVFNAMALGEYIKNGYGLVNLWDVANAFNGGDDHGMLNRGDANRDDFNPNPTFYSYYLTQLYFGEEMVAISPSEDQGVRSYATLSQQGDLSILVVNSGASNQVVELDLGDYSAEGQIYSHHLTANGPEEREIFLNGISQNEFSGPLNYSDILPYQWSFTGNPKFEVEAYSVNTYLIKSQQATTILHQKSQSNIQLFQLAVTGQQVIAMEQAPSKVDFFKLNGQAVQVDWEWSQGQLILREPLETSVLLQALDEL